MIRLDALGFAALGKADELTAAAPAMRALDAADRFRAMDGLADPGVKAVNLQAVVSGGGDSQPGSFVMMPSLAMRSVPSSATDAATTANGGGEIAAATNVSGGATGNFVLSPDSSKLFMAGADGILRIFDAASGALLGSTAIGTKLGAIDISPDGSFLLITEQQPAAFNQVSPWWDNTTESLVYKVNTTTYAVQQTYHYQSTGSDYVLADVAITAAGKAIFTENILPGWSGWTPMVTLDLASGTFTKTGGASFYQAGSLTASPDRTTVLFGQLNLSSAEARIFKSDLTQLAYNGVYQNDVYGYARGIEAYSGSGSGGRVAIATGGKLHLWDGNFGYIANLSATNAFLGNSVGLRFSADGQTLYAWSGSDGNVYGISMATFAIIETLTGSTSYPTTTAWGDELVLSPDDGTIFLSTAAGVVRLDHPNIASGTDGDDIFTGLARRDVYAGLGGNDLIHGNAGADDLSGGAGNDQIYGDDGDDILTGGVGIDTLIGGTGNDRLVVGAGNDGSKINGGADTDTLVVTGSVSLGGLTNVEVIELQNGANLTLTDGQFSGLALGTVLSGTGMITVNMTPDHFLLGSTLAVAPGSTISVVFNGSSGNDYVKAVTQATNTMLGGDGNDFLRGGQLADVIDGGAGGDKITGFGGADTLTGGDGVDQFRYLTQADSGLGANADHITDFTIGTDRLNFQLFDGDTNTPDLQNPGFAFLGNQAFHATGAAEIRYEDAGNDMVVQVDVNGDGVADMAIYLNGLHGQALTSADFML